MNSHLARLSALAALALAGTAHADLVIVHGDAADYQITLPEGDAPINTLQGLGPLKVGTFRETRPNPGTRQEADRRAIFQFDLASLLPFGPTITSADFSLFVPNQNSGIASKPVDLWGSSDNRSAVVNFGDAGAADEYDDASYSLVRPTVVPILTPPEYNQRYGGDVTAFLQARYSDFLANNAERYVFFRTQIAPNAGSVSAFFDFNTAEAGGDFMPRLTVNVVPTPGAGVLVLAGLAAATRRRR